eukprot:gene5322-6466_t
MGCNRSTTHTKLHVLVPFGGDFRFRDAPLEFDNMDRIIRYVNANVGRYNGTRLRYSTLRDYFSALREPQPPTTFPLIQGAAFKWTYDVGYFTSFPSVKLRIRQLAQLLSLGELWAALAALGGAPEPGRADAERARPGLLSTALEGALEGARGNAAALVHHDNIPVTGYGFNTADCVRRAQQSSKVDS